MTAHNIIHDDKLVSEHYRDCNGNSSAHVQGRRQLDCYQVYVKQHLPTTTVIHTRMLDLVLLLVGSKVTSCHCQCTGEFISHRMKVVSSVVVRSQDFRDE